MKLSPAPAPASTTADPWVIGGVRVALKRSARRRTVAVQVTPGAVTVYAPAGVPDATLEGFLKARRTWVEGHLRAYEHRTAPPTELRDGLQVPFLGEELNVRLDAGAVKARREGAALILPAVHPEAALEAWTREACRAPFRVLVQEYAQRLGAAGRLKDVRVTAARTRWGSCTALGVVRLHWRLSRAPLPVLHYVALHEAAHLLELNHSARYWRHVARVMPDWAQHRRWLQEHGHTLNG